MIVCKITSRPTRPITQLGDSKIHLDGPLGDPRLCHICVCVWHQQLVNIVEWAHFLNGPMNIDRTTQPSTGGPFGDRKFSLVSYTTIMPYMYSIVATLGHNYINEYYIPYLHTATMFTVRNRQTRVEYVTVRVVIGEVVWNERHMSVKRLNSQITNCSYCSVCSTACLGHSAYNKQLKAPRYWLFPSVTGVFPSRRQGKRFHVITPSVAPFTNMD